MIVGFYSTLFRDSLLCCRTYGINYHTHLPQVRVKLQHCFIIARKPMRTLFFLTVLLVSTAVFAEKASDEWQNTVLTDATIKKIQESKLEYKKCVGEQMQKSTYKDMDSRKATDDIIKQCEPTLSKMREVYLAEKMPGAIADRHLRQMRVQITRKVLEGLIFSQASRSAGQP
jgi:hypothetical protein